MRLPEPPDEPRANVEIRIDELVLHGFSAGDRWAIRDAMEAEMGRLVAERGAPPSWRRGGEVPSLDAGAFAVPPDARPASIGARIANAMYEGFNR